MGISRLRKREFTRKWVGQTSISREDLILPYFVVEGKNIKDPIQSMPGCFHFSVDNLIKDVSATPGIKAVLLFGVTNKKDEKASSAYKKDGIVQKTVKVLKKNFKNLVIITDVCLCGYTTHGHCGIIEAKSEERRAKSWFIDDKETLKTLAKIAVSHGDSGADLVAPSAMMDGQVGAIRAALDKNNFKDVGILAYSAKYASGFYGPFRDALDSTPRFGDRKSYQMDPRNKDEALREISEDLKEGADIVMVKPALAYLDIIYRAKQNFNVPIAAYNVSGEYAMVEAYLKGLQRVGAASSAFSGSAKGGGRELKVNTEDRKQLIFEILTSIKRAGADFIITYWAKDVLKWLK